jgi:hypothetical protein
MFCRAWLHTQRKKTKTNLMNIVDDKSFDGLWRDALEGHDELFSTSTIRAFLSGFFDQKPYYKFGASEIAEINNIINMISDVRIPTHFSGFSLPSLSMQHPTDNSKSVFANSNNTASVHASADTERKKYILDAMEKSLADPQNHDTAHIIKEGVKASIEYTLNYFTAPITAKNVQPHSLRKTKPINDPELTAQVEARELMKKLYVHLGGKLAPALPSEVKATPNDRLGRSWGGRDSNDLKPPVRAPTPLRM